MKDLDKNSKEEKNSSAICTFTREDTRAIKGVAVVLMLLHHLWCFPDRIPVELFSGIGSCTFI